MKKIIIGLYLSFMAICGWAAWPTQPVTLVIPFGPGSMATQVANAMQVEFETKFKNPLIIKYMPGAGHLVAANHIITESNDNHTLFWVTDDFYTSQYVQGTHLYNQFKPVVIIATHGSFVYGNSSASVENFKDKLKNKGTANIGNMGVNGGYDLWLKQVSHPGFTINPIPYKGAAAMQTDVLGGHLEYGMSVLATAKPLVDDGTIKIIMTTTLERNHAYKNIPTFRELGFVGDPYYGFYGMFTRKDTSAEAHEAMTKFLKEFVQSNSVFKAQQDSGMTISNATGTAAQKITADVIGRVEKNKNKISAK